MTAILDHLAIGTAALGGGWELFGGVLGGTWAYGDDSPGLLVGSAEVRRGPENRAADAHRGP